jgi:2-hydroxy-6-oxonona-2,4-dienedioate hydrolase
VEKGADSDNSSNWQIAQRDEISRPLKAAANAHRASKPRSAERPIMNGAYHSIWTELLNTPFRQAWIDAGGLKTRFVQAGDPSKPPLVMLHGTAGSLENFAANIAAHAQHFNCIAFDMIGSGMTDKPDHDYETDHYVAHALDFLNAIGIRKASVIGLSLGARVASRLAIDHAERVEKLVLLSATAYFPARPIQGDIKRSRSAAAVNPTWDSIVDIFKGLFHDPSQVWDDLIATRLAIYSRPDMKAAMPHILALLDPAVYDRNRIPDDDWKRLRAPTLIIAAVDHHAISSDIWKCESAVACGLGGRSKLGRPLTWGAARD